MRHFPRPALVAVARATACLALVACLLVPVVPDARAATGDAPVYSPAPTLDTQYSVDGDVWVEREGVLTVTSSPADYHLNGVTVYAYWVDEDGTVSPTYYDITRNLDGDDGQFAILLSPYTDANGVTHTFEAGLGEQLRVWIDNPDPSAYTLGYQESNGGLGTSTARDANFWNLPANEVNNWIITLREKVATADYTGNTVEDRTSGGTLIDFGNITGKVFYEFDKIWGNEIVPVYGLDDALAPGTKVYASYLTDAAVAQFEAYKASNPGLTEDQINTYIRQTVAADKSLIAETAYAVTDASGNYDLQFHGTVNSTGLVDTTDSRSWISKHVNVDYMMMRVEAPANTNVIGPFDSNNWQSLRDQSPYNVNQAVAHGASNVLFALGTPYAGLDVQTYNTSTSPALAGDTAPTAATGLPPYMDGYSIVWTDASGTEVGRCEGITTSDTGTLPSCPYTAPTSLTASTTFTATLLNPAGTPVSADSFLAIKADVTNPYGSVGDAYTGQVVIAPPPDSTPTYAASGLPPGLSIDPVTGAITGTPTAAGTYEVTYTVTITGTDGSTGTVTLTDSITITNTPLPDGDTGSSYTQTVAPQGYPSGSTISTPSASGLPPGLSYDAGTGQITGTPTAVGTFDVVVTYTVTEPDGTVVNVTDTVPVTITDGTAPVVAPIADQTVVEGTPITTVTVTTDDPTATITATGLPAGVTFDAGTGTISGTPTTPGTHTITVTATDPNGNIATETFTITVTPADTTPPTITPPLTDHVVPEDQPITDIVITVDDPTATITVTTLPDGLTFDAGTGTISGTPTTPGQTTVTVTATDPAGNSATSTMIITVTDATPPTITPITNQTVGEDETITDITVVVDDPTATVTVTGLPPNLSYNPSTGVISGDTVQPGTYPVTVTATDPAGNISTETFTITVTPDTTPPAITPTPDVTVPEDQPIAPIPVVTDDPDASISVSGLPDGVTFDVGTGQITGTPTTPGSYSVTVTATDPNGNTSTETFTITVSDETPPQVSPIADVSTPVNSAITPIPVTVDDSTATVGVTGLPPGVTYDPTTGQITGTPTAEGTFNVTVTVTDPAGNVTTETFTITVGDATAPTITPINDSTAPEDQPITPIPIVTDDPDATVGVTGLPPGVTYNPTTGQITGTPTVPGNYPVTITATDEFGNTSTETFTITVADTTPPVVSPITDQQIPAGTAVPPIGVKVDDPTATVIVEGLPDGVTHDPATGQITGIPTTPGEYPVRVVVTDPAGNTTVEEFIITVKPPMVTTIPDISVDVGVPISIPIVTPIPGYEVIVEGLPPGTRYDPETGAIVGTPGNPGRHEVRLRILREDFQVFEDSFIIDVNARHLADTGTPRLWMLVSTSGLLSLLVGAWLMVGRRPISRRTGRQTDA